MMDKYEQEMFNFLTQRENFEAMLRMKTAYTSVRLHLLEQFWALVIDKLEKKLIAIKGDWKVYNPPNKQHDHAKVVVYKESWLLHSISDHPFVGLAWEHLYTKPFYGVWYDVKSNKINAQKLINDLLSVSREYKMSQESEWWPAWKYGEYFLSDDADISNILPDLRDITAEMYAGALVNLLPGVERVVDNSIIPNKIP